MDLSTSAACRYPAMPRFARVALILAKYAALGIVPLAIPRNRAGPSDSDRADSASAGHRPAPTSRSLHWSAATSSTSSRDRRRAMSMAYWGPEVQSRHSAAGAEHQHGRAHQCRIAQLHASTSSDKTLPIVLHPGTGHARRSRSRSPIPDITPLNPPLGLIPPVPPKIEPLDRTRRKSSPLQAVMQGAGDGRAQRRRGHGAAARSTCCATGTC